MDLVWKIVLAGAMGYMAWRLWPAAKHYMEHGPKGTSSDWQTVGLLIAGVVAFVVILILLVR